VAIFSDTTNPCPYGFFNDESDFQKEADSIVIFVKRKLGDDILSVELTKKQIWATFEEATLEFSSILNTYQAKSQIVNFLGGPMTGSDGEMSGSEDKYPRENLDYLTRFAEPYSFEAGVGGSYNMISGSIDLKAGQQDYNIYETLSGSDGLVFSSSLNTQMSKMQISEIFHFSPQAAYRFFDTTSAINYLNNEFSFESFTPETIFYVLPVFEDILRAGQLDLSNRVRRSNYSYKLIGQHLRIYPIPTGDPVTPKKLWVRVRFNSDPLNPSYRDDTIGGVSNLSNLPFGKLQYSNINSIGRQWIRQFTLALSTELLGQVRSKFSNVPIPGAELQLNGKDLITNGREDQKQLVDSLKEMLETMTYDKLMETAAVRAENINKQLKFVPMPNGMAILMG
jgi:hypothetical protein